MFTEFLLERLLFYVIFMLQVGINRTEVSGDIEEKKVVKNVALIVDADDDDDDEDVENVDKHDKNKRLKKNKTKKRIRPEEWARQAALEEERRRREQQDVTVANDAKVEVEYIQVLFLSSFHIIKNHM